MQFYNFLDKGGLPFLTARKGYRRHLIMNGGMQFLSLPLRVKKPRNFDVAFISALRMAPPKPPPSQAKPVFCHRNNYMADKKTASVLWRCKLLPLPSIASMSFVPLNNKTFWQELCPFSNPHYWILYAFKYRAARWKNKQPPLLAVVLPGGVKIISLILLSTCWPNPIWSMGPHWLSVW